MLRGLYTSALGMTTQINKMDVVSNNIANADTTGFKKDITITQSFSDEMMKKLDDPKYKLIKHSDDLGNVNLGVFVDMVHTDFTSGSLKQTSGSLDLALDGEGFFSISVTDNNGEAIEKYTRDGSFTIDSQNRLVTKEGNLVLGESGPIVIPNGEINITDDGDIYSNGEFVDKLKLTDFENKETLRKFGDNLYDIIDETNVREFSGKITQGFLEASNVNTVQEMVNMITISRIYEANQKMIQTHDSTLGRAVNDLGKKA